MRIARGDARIYAVIVILPLASRLASRLAMRIRCSFLSQAALLAAAVLVTAPSRADAQPVAKVSVSPATSNCEKPVTLTVTLTEPARPGGAIVALSSSVPFAAPVAPNMLISSGATSGTARFRRVAGRQATTVAISAGAGAEGKSATLTVLTAQTDGAVRSITDGTSNTVMFGETPTRTGGTTTPPSTDGTSNTTTFGEPVTSAPTLNGLTLTSSEVAGGLSVIARLTATAGATGVTVSVFPNRAQAVTLPTTVVFAPGETAKTIVINTRPQALERIVRRNVPERATADKAGLSFVVPAPAWN